MTPEDNKEESIVRKIQAILRLAEDRKGTPEGETAAKHAFRLMREYAIDQSRLEVKEKIIELNQEIGRSNWLRSLFGDIAEFCSCKAFIWSGQRQMTIAGHESDIEIAHYLFDLVREQIERECKYYLAENPFIKGKGAANDFKMSAVYGVHTKLEEIKRNARGEDPTGTALVLSRGREVNAFVEAKHKLAKASAPKYHMNNDGFTVGKNVRLSSGISSSGTPTNIGPAPKRLKG